MKLRISSIFHMETVALMLVLLTLIVLTSGQGADEGNNSTHRASGRRNRQRNRGQNGRNRGNGRGRDRYARFGCEEIYLPMCKGLIGYTHTKLPNQFNHTTQEEVYRELDRLWPYMDHSCSKNTRVLACATYLPKCHGRRPPMLPCKKTCLQAKKRCASTLNDLMNFQWTDKFECRGLDNRRCVRPVREETCRYEYTNCVNNSAVNVCADLSFSWGTMPNMFSQCSIRDINTEIQYFDQLVATNCHDNLKFLLCGVFSPFCVRSEQFFTFPCKELCEEVRSSCEPHYRRLYHNLPWPQKLQCHRYPASDNPDFNCVMPNEGNTYFGGK